MTKFYIVLVLALMTLASTNLSSAELPDAERVALGFYMQPKTALISDALDGIALNYTISQTFHFGVKAGLWYTGATSTIDQKEANSQFAFEIYGRLFLTRMKEMNLYAQVYFGILSSNADTGSSQTSLGIDLGSMWFLTEDFALTGGLKFFQFDVDREQVKVGLGRTFIGMEYYF